MSDPYASPDADSQFFHLSFASLLATIWKISYSSNTEYARYYISVAGSDDWFTELEPTSAAGRYELLGSFLDMKHPALNPHGQEVLTLSQRWLHIWSISFSRYEFRLLFQYTH